MTSEKKIPPESVLEKLRKIKALAEQGRGGEAVAAQNKLEALLKKFGVSLAELQASEATIFDFHCSGKSEQNLLLQITAFILQSKTFRMFSKSQNGRITKTIGVLLFPHQFVDIKSAFDHYRKILKVEQVRLLGAFIQKHGLFPPSDGSEHPDPIDQEELKRTLAMMAGLSEKSWQKPVKMLEVLS